MRIIPSLLIIVCSLAAQGTWGAEKTAGGVTFTLGFESLPGKLFYRQDGIRYLSGTKRDFRYDQIVENVDFTVAILRVGKLVPLGSTGLSAGLEVGMSAPLAEYNKSWEFPALAPKFTGDVFFPSFCWGSGLNSYYSQVGKEENEVIILPMLAKIGYDRRTGDDLVFGVGVGVGAFMLYSNHRTTETERYVQDSVPWKEGDVSRNVYREHLAAVIPGGEASFTLAYRLSSSALLGLTARILAISKIKDTWEYTGYYATDWDPAEPELITLKNGYEYGGIGWGLGVTVSFWAQQRIDWSRNTSPLRGITRIFPDVFSPFITCSTLPIWSGVLP
jgi:hypothetical protein